MPLEVLVNDKLDGDKRPIKAEGMDKFALLLGFNMMGVGLVGAALSIMYPIAAIALSEIFEIEWWMPRLITTIFMVGGCFMISIIGRLVCESILKALRRDAESD